MIRIQTQRLLVISLSLPGPAHPQVVHSSIKQISRPGLAGRGVHLRDRLAEEIGRLPEIYREALILREYEGHSYQEIADMTGVSLGTVKSRIHRGRALLRLLTPIAKLVTARQAVAVVVGAFLFSLFHYVGPYGDPFQLASFTFRLVAGLVFTFAYIVYFKFIAPGDNTAEHWWLGISPEGIGAVGALLNFATAALVIVRSIMSLLAAQKRVVNMALELSGAKTLQRFAAEMDARAHLAKGPRRTRFKQDMASEGLKVALKNRDAPFGDGMVKIHSK